MTHDAATLEQFDADAFRFYRHGIEVLEQAKVPFLLGGAYAFGHYTGISRHTKDLDIFVQSRDMEPALAAFTAAGYRAETFFSHWLGKVFHGEDFLDLIFNSGNGLCPVDEAWFEHAVSGNVLGADVRLVPAEEMIWQKAFIMERERFDGADVMHLFRALGHELDWERLLTRFADHGRVLLAHLVLFGFVYPDEQDKVPAKVMSGLVKGLDDERKTVKQPCKGVYLSRTQYLPDLEQWHYTDPRLTPHGPLTREQIADWTDAGR